METPWEEDQGFAYLSPEEAFPALGELLLAAPVDTEQDEGPFSLPMRLTRRSCWANPFSRLQALQGNALQGCSFVVEPTPAQNCDALAQELLQSLEELYGVASPLAGEFTFALEDSAVVEQYGTVTYAASHSGTQLELAIQYQGDTARGLALFLARTPTEEP